MFKCSLNESVELMSQFQTTYYYCTGYEQGQGLITGFILALNPLLNI